MKTALLVIDVQNDYFAGGGFPLWNTDDTLATLVKTMEKAQQRGVEIVLVQHVSDGSNGPTGSFDAGTPGVAIHSTILAAAPQAPIVVKHFADSFYETNLEAVLATRGIKRVLVCGMMTQNCVVFTALSKGMEKYEVAILPDCCTSVSEAIHKIALRGISTRVALVSSLEALT